MRTYDWNGSAFKEADSLALNRGFLYADGFFETILIREGVPAFWKVHAKRAFTTADFLGIPVTSDDINGLTKFIQELKHEQARWRVTFYRKGAGKYYPTKSQLGMYIQLEEYDKSAFNQHPQKTWALSHEIYHYDPSNRFKLLARHRQVRYALSARDQNVDDLVLLNAEQNAVCSISGNLIVWDGQHWCTPDLESGALMGTIRQVLIDEGLVEARSVSKQQIESCSALLSTNAIEGIRDMKVQDGLEEKVMQLKEMLSELQANSIRDFLENQP